MHSPNSTAIRINGVSKIYKLHGSHKDQVIDVLGLQRFGFRPKTKPKKFKALNSISLEVRQGDRIGIVGRNGAGKTTLLKLISGNFAPTQGEVEVNGKVQALMSVGFGFHPEYTGRENIEASLQYNDLEYKEYNRAVEEIIEFCELGPFIDQPFKSYSLGMQSRLQFAVATAIEPEILIIDEILGSGDMYFSAKSAERVEKLAYSGCTLLVVSHDMSQILKFCTRAIWLDSGSIVMDGSPQEVINAYEVFSQNLITSSLIAPLSSSEKSEVSSWLESKINLLDNNISEGEQPDASSVNQAFMQTLEGGQKVYRWPGAPGVKFFSILLNGGDVAQVRRGHSFKIEYTLKIDTTFKGDIRIHASIFGKDGERKAWVTGAPLYLNGSKKENYKIICEVEPLLLSAGEYLISTSIFSAEEPEQITKAIRYDLVSRCLQLNVVDSDARSPAIYHQPSNWELV